MKTPRDLGGKELAKALSKLGYRVTRTTASHMRLTTDQGGVHHVTVPNHSPLRVGTLAAILDEVGRHAGLSREDLLSRLAG